MHWTIILTGYIGQSGNGLSDYQANGLELEV